MSRAPLDAQMSPAVRRLFAIAASIARSPGITFEQLREDVTRETGRPLGVSTLHKDIQRLKQLSLLVGERHRDGYYLTAFTVDAEERKALLGALRLQAEDLDYPPARELYRRLEKRMAGPPDGRAETYPVEAVGERVTVDTSEPEYVALLEALRTAIAEGQAGTLAERFNPRQRMGPLKQLEAYPLQLVFHGRAWHVLVESIDDERQRFHVLRLDRLHPRFEASARPPRGIHAQWAALSRAKAVMLQGWDLAPPQRAESTADDLEIVVAFDDEAMRFLGEIKRGYPLAVEPAREGALVRVRLPAQPVCLQEFKHWLVAWTYHARVLAPRSLADELARTFARAAARYEAPSGELNE